MEEIYRETEGELVVIVCGGVENGLDLLRYVEAGASAAQLPSPLVAEGPQAVRRIKDELSRLLMNEGYVNLEDAIGGAHRKRRKARAAKNPWKARHAGSP